MYNIAIVASRFNKTIVDNLVKGARFHLVEKQKFKEPEVFWVPGAFEIPVIAKTLAKSKKYHAIICLGAVIRGETAHFDYVAGQVAAGIQQTSLETGIPISFGVLTTENWDQAEQRSSVSSIEDLEMNNKGCEAAETALDMIKMLEEITSSH